MGHQIPTRIGCLLALALVLSFIVRVEPGFAGIPDLSTCTSGVIEMPPQGWVPVDIDGDRVEDGVMMGTPDDYAGGVAVRQLCLKTPDPKRVDIGIQLRVGEGGPWEFVAQCAWFEASNLLKKLVSPENPAILQELEYRTGEVRGGKPTGRTIEFKFDLTKRQGIALGRDPDGNQVGFSVPYEPTDSLDALPNSDFFFDRTRQTKKGGSREQTSERADDVPAPPPAPPTEPPPPPDSGGGWGEPHLWTFDGLAYDFQAAGEYVFARATGTGPSIHARFGRSGLLSPVSFNRGLAVRDGRSLVTFSDAVGLDFFHSTPVHVDGRLVTEGELPIDLRGGGRLLATSDRYHLTTGDGTLIEVSRDDYPWYVVTPAPPLAGALEGLLGDFDGDPANDIVGDLYGGFAERWRVPPGDSLFTTTLTDVELFPTYPLVSVHLSQFPGDAVSAALAACRAAGVDPSTLEDCAIDVLVTGTTAAATAGAAAVASFAVGTLDRDAPPATQRLAGAVGVPVVATVPGNEALEIAVPVEADRAFRIEPGLGCTASPLVATVETPGTNTVATVDLGSCTDDRIFGTGPHGGELIVSLRALATDIPAAFTVLYADAQLGNGSFELPVIESPFLTLGAGATIGPWNVTAGDVDLQFTWATAQHGRQSVDMSGFVGGKLCQSVATTPGATYDVSFWMSHNAVAVTSASLSAGITGITSLPFDHDADSTNADPKWEQHVFDFTATGSASELCFESTDPPVGSGPTGAAMVDNVTVTRR